MVLEGGATTFPVPIARGASWDDELEERIGEAIAREARSFGANWVAAVCINLLRHPGWGRAQETYGEEREHPLSRRQMHWLKYRHGVYFPWKVYVEMIPNRWWGDKADPAGKRFTRLAETLLPRTVAFVRSLPFAHIGRCNLMGLESNDHGTVHRDGDPAEQDAPDQFVTFCPGGPKALYLWDPELRERTPIAGRAYWFNDFDHHGVEAAPGFQYSIRVDGAFTDGFFATLARDFGGAP